MSETLTSTALLERPHEGGETIQEPTPETMRQLARRAFASDYLKGDSLLAQGAKQANRAPTEGEPIFNSAN